MSIGKVIGKHLWNNKEKGTWNGEMGDVVHVCFPYSKEFNEQVKFLKNGFKLNDVFEIVKNFKKTEYAKPTILMGYYNQILQYGENKFLNKCKNIGVDGLIVVDLPFPENKDFAEKCKTTPITNFQGFVAKSTATAGTVNKDAAASAENEGF